VTLLTRAAPVVGAIIGIALVHYAFLQDRPQIGFLGVLVATAFALAASLAQGGTVRSRLFLFVIGGLSVAGALGHGGDAVLGKLLIAVPLLFNALMLSLFGGSLRPGRIPLITRFSRFERGPAVDPRIECYTRRLTALWAAFFAAVLAVASAAALSGALVAASWICSVFAPGAAFAIFIAEHLYRGFRKDVFGGASLFGTLRIMAQSEAWRG
jgi:uncharacterized membrane protein